MINALKQIKSQAVGIFAIVTAAVANAADAGNLSKLDGKTATTVTMLVEAKAGAFTFLGQANGPIGVRQARLGLEVNGKFLWAAAAVSSAWDGEASGQVPAGGVAHARYRFEQPKVEWVVEFSRSSDGRVGFVSSTISNLDAQPVTLGLCQLMEVSTNGGSVVLGANPEQAVVFASPGGLLAGKSGTVFRINSGKEEHTAQTLAQFYNPASGGALQVAFLTFDRVATMHNVSWLNAKNSAGISSFCDFKGFKLPPGKSVASEKLMLQAGDNPNALLADWADRVAAQYQPHIWPKTPAGWIGWSWNEPFVMERYEDAVRRNAAAIRRRLAGFEIDYIWVSMGNLAGHLPGNWLLWDTNSIPSGPEKFVADLRQLDFKLGLWIAPFWWCPQAQLGQAEGVAQAVLYNQGRPVTSRPWVWADPAKFAADQLPRMFTLDPTNPKAAEFLRNVFATYHRWGIRYYMIDFLGSLASSKYDQYHDLGVIPGPELYRAGLKIVREAAGPDTYLLSSSGPTFQNIGLMDGCRVGGDYGEGRPLAPWFGFYPGTYMVNTFGPHRNATAALASAWFTHRKLFLADSGNVITVDKPVPLAEAQITATIFGINGSPMMIGDDVDRMSDERLAMIKQNLPRLSECAESLDLFDTPAPDYPKAFHLRVNSPWDQWDLVAVFNYGGEMLKQTIPLKRLGLDAAGKYSVWDFWDGRYAGAASGNLVVTVPPQSVRLLRLSRQREHPWVISTDMHLRQGQAEIADCRWDAATMTLTFKATRPVGEKGSVFVRVPKGLKVQNPQGLFMAKIPDESMVIRCALDFHSATVEQKITFASYAPASSEK